VDEANRIQDGKAHALWDDLNRKEEAKPAGEGDFHDLAGVGLHLCATDLTSTGLMNKKHFDDLSTLWDQSYGDYVRARTAALQKQDPTTDWWNSPVDVSDMPRFQYKEEAVGARIAGALPRSACWPGWACWLSPRHTFPS